jgi:tryptophan-rich sensory protein
VIDALSTPRNRTWSFTLLVICGLLAIAATAVGIDDNPPGVLLASLAATAFVLAFAHPWRTARKFIFLFLASLLGVVLFIILDIVAQNPATTGAIQNLLQSPAMDVFNIIFAMICFAAFIVGALGSVVMFIRNLRQPT